MIEREQRATSAEHCFAFLPGGVRFFDEIDQIARLSDGAAVRERTLRQPTSRTTSRISLCGADDSSVRKTNTTERDFAQLSRFFSESLPATPVWRYRRLCVRNA